MSKLIGTVMGKMPTSFWGQRAHAAGLDQKTLAQLAGAAPNSVSRGLRGEWASGVSGHLRSLILAWELMSPEQRAAWLKQVMAEEAAPGEADS